MRFKYWLEAEELNYLRDYLKNPSFDVASHTHDFLYWKGSKKLLAKLGINQNDFQQALENGNDEFYEMAEKINKSISDSEKEDFYRHMSNTNPGDVPSHSLMDLQTQSGRKGY